MKPEAAWVIGAGGLLGSAMVRALSRRPATGIHQPAQRLAWGDNQVLAGQLEAEMARFADAVRRAERWLLVWAAGVGSMSSHPEALAVESQVFDLLCERLAANETLRRAPGTLVLASSAGAIYGQSRADHISESTPVTPATAYAEHKLRQEARLQRLVEGQGGWSALIARYSTLYGVGQSLDKPQGLITQLARRIVANEVIHVFVPLDTLRDYIFTDDAAQRTLDAVDCLRGRAGQAVSKIIAAEQSTSIAQLIGLFRRVSRRPVRLVTSVNALSPLYVRCVRFRSVEAAGQPHSLCRSLQIGIHQVLEAERLAVFRRNLTLS